ncbi:MAG: FtsB family cell division protein [Hyphomicrobiales bacterium]
MGKRKFDMVITGVSAALLGYFAWHGFEGPRGFPYRDRLTADAGRLGGELAAIRQQRESLELRVSQLRPQSVDPDLLDEMARAMLGMTRPGELVVLGPPQIPQGNP